MCFSAPASFVAGAALTATGVVTTRAAKRRARLFAAIPLFFGIQQFLDGIAWISAGSTLQDYAAYGYAFFAYVFWPVWVPLAVLQLEERARAQRVIRVLLGLGVLVSVYAIVLMLAGPVTARAVNACIRYDTAVPYWPPILALYMLATCGACIASSHTFIKWFGALTAISALIAGWFYFATFSSVWCFFAAVLSAMIYWYVQDSASQKRSRRT